MIRVYNHDLESALRAFKKQVQQQGTLRELKKRSFYEKPSAKRKRKYQESRKRMNRITASYR